MSLAHRTPGRILVICCPDLLAGPAAPEAPPPIAGPPPAPDPQPDAGELPADPVFAHLGGEFCLPAYDADYLT